MTHSGSHEMSAAFDFISVSGVDSVHFPALIFIESVQHAHESIEPNQSYHLITTINSIKMKLDPEIINEDVRGREEAKSCRLMQCKMAAVYGLNFDLNHQQTGSIHPARPHLSIGCWRGTAESGFRPQTSIQRLELRFRMAFLGFESRLTGGKRRSIQPPIKTKGIEKKMERN